MLFSECRIPAGIINRRVLLAFLSPSPNLHSREIMRAHIFLSGNLTIFRASPSFSGPSQEFGRLHTYWEPPNMYGASQIYRRLPDSWDSPKKEGGPQNYGRSPKYWERDKKQGVSRKHGKLLIIWEPPRKWSSAHVFSTLDGG